MLHTDDTTQLSPTKQALLAVREARARLDALREPIAVVGCGCRLPGGVESPRDLWRLLDGGGDAVCEVPPERWDAGALYAADRDAPGKMCTREGGFLRGEEGFDAAFFGVSPREAETLDPQQQLLLEVAWEALENAGISPRGLHGSPTGVFVGISSRDFEALLAARDPAAVDGYLATGSAHSVAAGRLSFLLGLGGPSLAVDTACSSALAAVHLACRSLRAGECDLALAGGVNRILTPELSVNFSRNGMLSPDGRCKAFAATADGFGRGEGCGVVLLKRLSDATAAGDPVLAVVLGSAVNHDGRTSGLTVPNGRSQQEVIRRALAEAGVAPGEVGYVEAHGTGTALGDPIEAGALAAVFGPGRAADDPLVVGSVKTNLGHLEAAAGIAGLLKVVLALEQGEIPPHLHCATPSPHIPWDEVPLAVATRRREWPARARRIAGVSSFGFSGTNVHVVVAEAPPAQPAAARRSERAPRLLAISARSEAALAALAGRYARRLAETPAPHLADLCAAAHTGRAHLEHRLAALAATTAEAREKLGAVAEGRTPAGVWRGQKGARPRIAFLFTGQGSLYPGMGRGLYAAEPVFHAALDRCDELLRPLLVKRLLDVLHPAGADDPDLRETAFAQPALFAFEWALAELWRSWGIVPDAVLGHSVGELVAACVAGVFELPDALAFVAERARLMQAMPRGAMAAVHAPEERVAEALAPHAERVSIAAVNGPQHVVIAGDADAVDAVLAACGGAASKRLAVSHAFHSPLMEPLLPGLGRLAARFPAQAPAIELISNLTGRAASAELADPSYWARQARERVRFLDGVRTLDAGGTDVYLELGPAPVLSRLGRRCVPDGRGTWLAGLAPGRPEIEAMQESLAALYVRGAEVDWNGFEGGARPRVALPNYPWQRRRFGILAAASPSNPLHAAPATPAIPLRPAAAPPAPPAPRPTTRPAGDHAMGFGLMFFAASHDALRGDKYRLVVESARFADAHGFAGVWLPERHFTRFGGLYPNPAVLHAALARETRHVRLRAGSVVLPLHDPLRVAEEWAVVDNLSGGRVEVSFASGWNPDDFALFPERYADRRRHLMTGIETVRKLWRGESIPVRGGRGDETHVRVYPSPVQPELPVWVTAAGNPETFAEAGRIGAHLLTHLLDQGTAPLAANIALYREARARHGHDPAAGRVAVMLHTFLGADAASVREEVRGPYCEYLASNLDLLRRLGESRGRGASLDAMSPADRTAFAGFLFDRFAAERGLIGTPEGCLPLVAELRAIGVDEIACLLDFGPATERVLEQLPYVEQLMALWNGQAAGAAAAAPIHVELESPHLTAAATATPLQPPLAEALVGIEWRPAPLRAPAAVPQPPGTWLILADAGGTGAALATALAERGARAVAVETARPDGNGTTAAARGVSHRDHTAGGHAANGGNGTSGEDEPSDGKDSDQEWRVVDSTDAGALLSLVASLRADAGPPLRGVVHLLALDTRTAADTTLASLAADQESAVASALHLIQALAHEEEWPTAPGRTNTAPTSANAPSLDLLFVTRGAQPAGGDLPAPVAAPLWGLARVAAMEVAALRTRVVDLEHATPPETAAAQLAALLTSPDGEDLVAFRNGERLVARLVRLPAPREEPPPQFDEDAVYLVTGGLGGLGLELASWLVEHGARRLILAGRHGADASAAEAVRGFEQAGARVAVVAADVARAQDVERLLAAAAALDAPLRGIFHLAGLPDARLLAQQDAAGLARARAAKVEGTWNLHALTRNLALDRFVMFSSAASLLPLSSQGAYAAASAFLDAMAHYRRSQGLAALTVNWGPWSGAGHASHDDLRAAYRRFAALGVGSFSAEEGLAMLGTLLQQPDLAQVGVARIDVARLLEVEPLLAERPVLADLAPGAAAGRRDHPASTRRDARLLAALADAPAEDRHGLLATWVREHVARVLRLDGAAEVDPRQGFFDMGMDSLMALELRGLLQADLGRPLPATVAFEHATADALARHLLARELSLPLASAAAGANGGADPAVAEVARLSEAELAAAIDEELARGGLAGA